MTLPDYADRRSDRLDRVGGGGLGSAGQVTIKTAKRDPMQRKARGDLAVASRQNFPLVMAALPINERERRIALGVIILLLCAAVIVAPFANTPLARIDAFVPVLQTAMCVVDLVTAALLFAQYTIYPKKALLAVAGGYAFSGLFAFMQTLAFPGAYSATGLIGDGINSAAWIFVLWHSLFAIAVIVYALTKDAKETGSLSGRSATATIGFMIACIVAAMSVIKVFETASSAN